MTGTEKIRICAGCNREVYNLSAMTCSEVKQLLDRGTRKCVFMTRGSDGRVLTLDRLPRKPRPAPRPVAALAAVVTALQLTGVVAAYPSDGQSRLSQGAVNRTSSGSLSGTIYESNGERFPGVHVLARNEATGEEFGTQTDEHGRYALHVPPGRYFVDMSLAGYCQTSGVRVRSIIATRLDARLMPTLVGEVIRTKPCGNVEPRNTFIRLFTSPFRALVNVFQR
jgi:hypothetical protein